MAYTKYSLTPANNTATPPDGAPEGMLPSAVNDTMRDMMAQIRDCGDGIRDGTYTMTAPKITGGTITGAAFTGNTFTSPVISGGSINNTPIGATTANTGAFTTLSATGVTTVQAGTNSAPAITTSGDTNTGIFFPAADTIAFTEGGVESMRIDSSGNVGIGTSSPNVPVDSVSNTSFAIAYRVRGRSTDNIGTIQFTNNAASSEYAFVRSLSSSALLFGTGGSERFRIDSSGNVGIGTTAPQAVLDLGAGTAGRGLTWGGSTGANRYASIFAPFSNGGIVLGASFHGSTSADSYINSYTGTTYANGIRLNTFGADGIQFFTDGSASKTAGNAFTPTERMRIDSSGNLLVGITSARSNAGDVQVSKGISFPATQSAQTDANTLDDYEEGTWTPTGATGFPGGGAPTNVTATYTKVGNMVSVRAQFEGYNDGTSLLIGGLPFTSSGDASCSVSNSARSFTFERVSGTGIYCTASGTDTTSKYWYISATYRAA